LQTTPKDIEDVLTRENILRDDINIILKEFNNDIKKQLVSILIYDDFMPIIDFLKKN